MKYVDIHSHLTPAKTDETVVRNLSFEEADSILAASGAGFFSVGIHPWHLNTLRADWYEKLELLCTDNRIMLIGECGLDKNQNSSFRLQTEIFEKHILLSETISKPLLIHCVGCFNELIDIRKKHKTTQKWIIHGFRGKPQLAEQILRTGCDISFGEKFNPESVKNVSVERLFVETDESTLPIADIYRKIATTKNCNVEDLTAGNKLISIFTI